ncbi:Fc.00g051940.m01.CDS01 [Cosmosporella sp. VM-42]
MASSLFSLFVLLAFVFGIVSALEVTPGSSCSTFCLGLGEESNGFDPKASTTNTSEITCKDTEYATTDIGIKFKSCIECLQKSEKVNGTEFDLNWYLYNLRYTISTCLFSVPNKPLETDIDSPCVIDYACRPLKDPLTADNLSSTSNDTYGYCSTDNGEFRGKTLWPCISCLQSSGDQVYLSNFMIALEAGCEQKPAAGSVLSLSGSLFSTSEVNITTPTEDIREKPKGAGSGTMTTGTIVGIAVGIGLFFFGGLALLFVHCRRQRKQKQHEKGGYYGSNAGTPDPILPQRIGGMSRSLRSYSDGGHRDKNSLTTGEYYDKLEEEANTGGRRTYNFDPRAGSRGPNSALPTHEAYVPRTMSRVGHNRAASEVRGPSPLPPVYQHTRSKTSDSYALQTYLNDGEDTASVNLPPPPGPPPARMSKSPERRPLSINVPPPPSGPPPPKQSMIPSLILPSLSKLRMPKKYTPPTVVVEHATPVDEPTSRWQELKISQPVMSSEQRFNDRPLAGGVVYADRAPDRTGQDNRDYNDQPIRSGKSTLYGY